jgi:hypothetical protein
VSILGGWLLAPLVFALLALGLGLLAERAAGVRLPAGLVPGVGLCALIVVGDLLVTVRGLHVLATPCCAALAVFGLAVGRPWADERLRGGWWIAVLVGAGGYLLYAAPSLLTGQGSIAGYIKLDDSSTWLALTDRIMDHGRDSTASPSTYERVLHSWLDDGYPVGAFVPLGVTAKLSGQDAANAYQPLIASYAGVLALGLYSGIRGLVRTRWLAALTALVAIQASLAMGYAQWGGIKELATAAVLPAAALVGLPGRAREFALACLAAGALLCVLGVPGGTWAIPALGVAAAALLWRERRIPLGVRAGVPVLAISLVPVLATLGFGQETTQGAISAQSELGNLLKPLPLLQGFGLYPDGDFRLDPDPKRLAVLLAIACFVASIAAVAWAAERRWPSVPVLVGVVGTGTIPAVAIGAPWIDAKALAIFSPFLLTGTVALIAAGLERAEARPFALIGASFAVAGAAWSTFLVQRDVFVAPRARMVELRDAAAALKGRGPVLVLDFEAYAQRHFLRHLVAEGATDLRVHTIPDVHGREFPDLSSAEVDDIQPAAFNDFNALVRRRTPVGSRPPSEFTRVWAGPNFEAWARMPGSEPPLAHIALGSDRNPAAVPKCSQVAALAKTPGAAALAAVPRTPPLVLDVARGRLPPGWDAAASVYPRGSGTLEMTVSVPHADTWRLWVGGATLGTLTVSVDGHSVGSKRHELSYDGQWMRLGTATLAAGSHVVALHYDQGSLFDAGRGSGVMPAPLGPLALTALAEDNPQPVVKVPVSQLRRLCDGRAYDWLEALG